MTPKEKSFQLVKKFIWFDINAETDNIDYDMIISELRYCPIEYALIVVDEFLLKPTPKQKKYWLEVKNELLKLK